MDIGARIVSLRKERGWTTNRLANRCGLSQSFLRSVELGEKGISVDSLLLVCEALDLSPRDFFDFSEGSIAVPDPLAGQVARLTPRQRQALAAFLSAMDASGGR